MSFIPINQLEGPNLIAQFIIEYRGRGHFLPYDDHLLVKKWISEAGDVDTLLVVLSDIIPKFFQNAIAQGKHPPSLQRIDRKVSHILEARRKNHMAPLEA